jgi:hypothetical protein
MTDKPQLFVVNFILVRLSKSGQILWIFCRFLRLQISRRMYNIKPTVGVSNVLKYQRNDQFLWFSEVQISEWRQDDAVKSSLLESKCVNNINGSSNQ